MIHSRFRRISAFSLVIVALFLLLLFFGPATAKHFEGTRFDWASGMPQWASLLVFIPWILVLLVLIIAAKNTAKWFCHVAFWEGVSYLLLLFVAMPLKYFADMPLAVKYVGWAHGALFIAYVIVLIAGWIQEGWHGKRVGGYFIASLLPFVPFWVEVRLKREIAAREGDNYEV